MNIKSVPSLPKALKLVAFAVLTLIFVGVGTAYFGSFKWVTVYAEEDTYHMVSVADTVSEVLEELDFDLRDEDYVSPSREEQLTHRTAIAVVKAKPYTVQHDGKESELWSVGKKVADVLLDAEVEWNKQQDIVLPPPESPAPVGKDIEVVRVATEIEYQEVVLSSSARRVPNRSLYTGQERLVQTGSDGQKVNTYKVTYHDDQEVQREVLDTEVLVEAEDTIVEYGTISSISRGRYQIGIRGLVDVKATAYCSGVQGSGCPTDSHGHARCTGKYNSGYTSIGRAAEQGDGTRENPYLIAVDPKEIPLNSLVYLSFNGGRVVTQHGEIITDGFALAADVGSAIKGNRIDILFDNHWVAYYFGHQSVRVFLVENVSTK